MAEYEEDQLEDTCNSDDENSLSRAEVRAGRKIQM